MIKKTGSTLFLVVMTLVLAFGIVGSAFAAPSNTVITTTVIPSATPVCPIAGGWQVTEGIGGNLYDCHGENPYFYGITGKTPTLPIEYTPYIDWQCLDLNNCVLPQLP